MFRVWRRAPRLAGLRGLSSLGNPMAPSAGPLAAMEEAPRAPAPSSPLYDNWFYNNPGYTFLGVVAAVVAGLVRSSYSVADRTRVEEEVEALTFVEPEELAEVCRGNAMAAEEFVAVVRDTVAELGLEDVSYPSFVLVVGALLRRRKPEARRLQPLEGAHIIDRMVMGLMSTEAGKRHGNASPSDAAVQELFEATPEWDGIIGLPGAKVLREKLPIRSLFTALSIAMDGHVLDTSDALFEMLRLTSSNGAVSMEDVEELLDALQLTGQLPCYVQVVKDATYIPIQRYRGASPQDMIVAALREKPRKGEEPLVVDDPEHVDKDFLQRLLMAKGVCLLGQCPKV